MVEMQLFFWVKLRNIENGEYGKFIVYTLVDSYPNWLSRLNLRQLSHSRCGPETLRPAKRRRAPGGPTAWLSHWQILQDDHTNPYPMGSFDDNTNPEKGSKVV